MTLDRCSKEPELMTVLREQRWPEACEPSLREHVENCSHCGDLVVVTQRLQQARMESTRGVSLPPPGILWWRAQLQRRNEAIARINQPVVMAAKIAWLGLLAVVFGIVLWQKDGIDSWVRSLAPSGGFDWSASGTGGWAIALLAAAVGTITLLGGVAVYLVTKEE